MSKIIYGKFLSVSVFHFPHLEYCKFIYLKSYSIVRFMYISTSTYSLIRILEYSYTQNISILLSHNFIQRVKNLICSIEYVLFLKCMLYIYRYAGYLIVIRILYRDLYKCVRLMWPNFIYLTCK